MDTFLPTLTVAGVLGFLAPLAVSALNKLTFKPMTKQIMAVAVSVIFAIVALWVTGGFATIPTAGDPVTAVLLLVFAVIAVSQLAYSLIWKPTGVADRVALATSTNAERSAVADINTQPTAPAEWEQVIPPKKE
jgi:hypothetical protein